MLQEGQSSCDDDHDPWFMGIDEIIDGIPEGEETAVSALNERISCSIESIIQYPRPSCWKLLHLI